MSEDTKQVYFVCGAVALAVLAIIASATWSERDNEITLRECMNHGYTHEECTK